MSTSQREDNGEGLVSPSLGQWLRKNKRNLRGLPEPGTKWTVAEVPAGIKRNINALSQNDIISRVGIIYDPDPGDSSRQRTEYKTDAACYKRLQQFLERSKEQDGLLPCSGELPHDGFTNLGENEHGETILKCMHEDCGQEHTQKAVENYGGINE